MTQSVLKLSIVIAFATTCLAACAQTGIGVTSQCSVWRPISWSQKDTIPTIDGVKSNNARQKAWCGEGGR